MTYPVQLSVRSWNTSCWCPTFNIFLIFLSKQIKRNILGSHLIENDMDPTYQEQNKKVKPQITIITVSSLQVFKKLKQHLIFKFTNLNQFETTIRNCQKDPIFQSKTSRIITVPLWVSKIILHNIFTSSTTNGNGYTTKDFTKW